jgi:hypothetical protein
VQFSVSISNEGLLSSDPTTTRMQINTRAKTRPRHALLICAKIEKKKFDVAIN